MASAIIAVATRVVGASHAAEMVFDFGDDDEVKDASACMAPAIYVVAGGHVSSAKYELQEMGCLRFVVSGARTVVLIDSSAIKMHGDMAVTEGGSEFTAAESWANTASEDSLREFVSKGGQIFTATTGPLDVLYMPAGWICLHKVQQASDSAAKRKNKKERQRTTSGFASARALAGTLRCSKRPGATNAVAARTRPRRTRLFVS